MKTFSKHQILGTAGIITLLASGFFFAWWMATGRFIQSTDDAYVAGNITAVASKVPGYIARIEVRDNQLVKAGDVILRLDNRDYTAVVAQSQARVTSSKSRLESIRSSIVMQRSIIQSAGETWQAAQLETLKSQRDSIRYERLAASSAISQQIKDNALLDYRRMAARERKAASDYQAEKQRLAVLSAQEDTARATVEEARSGLAQAQLDLEYSVVLAPIDGRVANRNARTGSWVASGTHLVSLVPNSALWIDANFKEDQIAGMQPGMRAEIRVDILKGKVFHGHVESLSPATGASFSLIPVENATGNFTKIVQRVPVRIVPDANYELMRVLRPGLSVSVSVNEKS